MAKFNKTWTDFSFGILSRKMAGRIDTDNYSKGLSDAENFLSTKSGALIKRPGTQYFVNASALSYPTGGGATTHDLTANAVRPAIFPFYPGDGKKYLIVLNFVNVGSSFKDRISIIDASNGTSKGISGATGDYAPDVYTTNNNMYAVQSGNFLFIIDSQGLGRPFCIWYDASIDTFVAFDFLNNLSSAVAKYHLSMPYLDRNVGAISLSINTATVGTGRTLTASASFFSATHVGTRFKVVNGTTEGVCLVTAYTNVTTVTVTVEIAFGAAGSASTNWAESAWSDYQGWPRTVCCFENRLWFGGTKKKPDTVWGSMIENPFHFMQERLLQNQGSTDVAGDFYFGSSQQITDPVTFTIGANRANNIKWMISKSALAIGTVEEEYIVTGGSDILSYSNPGQVKQQTACGSNSVFAVAINDYIVYINRTGQELYLYQYNDTNGSYISRSLNILNPEISEHSVTETLNVPNSYIRKIVYQESRNTIWALTNENNVLSMTISDDGKTAGWFKHVIGHYALTAKVEDICVLTNSQNSFDEVYFLVSRLSGNTFPWYIERMSGDYRGLALDPLSYTYINEMPIYLDSAKITAAPVTTTLTGLTDYKTEKLYVVADGNEIGEFTVNSSGEITLPAVYTTYIITGYKYTAFMETMDIEAGAEAGDSAGMVKRIDRIFVKFDRTRCANFGTSSSNTITVPFTSTTTLFNGDKKEQIVHSPEEQGKVYISQTYAYPMTILSISARGVTYD